MEIYYILDNEKNVVTCDNLAEWGEFMENGGNRRVADTLLPDGKRVSTVFLGIDYRMCYEGDKKPLVFETMVFPSNSYVDLFLDRYETWEEALKGHEAVVKEWSVTEHDE